MLPSQREEHFRLMVVMTQGIAITRDMLASLWEMVCIFCSHIDTIPDQS